MLLVLRDSFVSDVVVLRKGKMLLLNLFKFKNRIFSFFSLLRFLLFVKLNFVG